MLDQPSAAEPAFGSQPAPGRACGTCTLCCKVYDVATVPKRADVWCPHCRPGRGCGIYETRPDQCRDFHCLWMTQTWLGQEWKPERAKMVLSVDPGTNFLLVQVDPGTPNAWRGEPYYRNLKQWASGGMARRRHVLVFHGKVATVVLPDRDVPLGPMGPGDRVVTRERQTAAGIVYDVEKGSA